MIYVKDIIDKFIAIIKQYPSVLGMHDLEMHCYGAHKIYASIHVEVDSRQNIMDIHEIIDDIEKRCDKELGIRTIIHMDPVLVNDEETKEYKEEILKILNSIDPDLSIHDFRVTTHDEKKRLSFDVKMTTYYFSNKDKLKDALEKEIKIKYPNIELKIDYDEPFEDLLTNK
mgnify:FL=1